MLSVSDCRVITTLKLSGTETHGCLLLSGPQEKTALSISCGRLFYAETVWIGRTVPLYLGGCLLLLPVVCSHPCATLGVGLWFSSKDDGSPEAKEL